MKKLFTLFTIVFGLSAVASQAEAAHPVVTVRERGPFSYYHHDGRDIYVQRSLVPRHKHWRTVYRHDPHLFLPPPVVWKKEVIYVTPTVTAMPLAATPTSVVFTNDQGQYCREYQATAVVGGSASVVYGTACLQPDGAWRVVD